MSLALKLDGEGAEGAFQVLQISHLLDRSASWIFFETVVEIGVSMTGFSCTTCSNVYV